MLSMVEFFTGLPFGVLPTITVNLLRGGGQHSSHRVHQSLTELQQEIEPPSYQPGYGLI